MPRTDVATCRPIKLIQFPDAAQASQGRATGRPDDRTAIDRHPGRRPGQAHAVRYSKGAAAAGRNADARARTGPGRKAHASVNPRGLWTWWRAGAGSIRRWA